MNELQTFQNPEFGSVRTTIIDGEPWFVGKDVCNAFGDTNHKRSLSRLDDEDKAMSKCDTPGGMQEMTVVNESGLYTLLFNMQPHKAKGGYTNNTPFEERITKLRKFKRWVTSEVLPTLRRTGKYAMKQVDPFTKNDYVQAAQIVSNANNKALPYVLEFLGKAGFEISEVEKPLIVTRSYNFINDSASGFLQCCPDVQIEGVPTNVVYAQYQDYCERNNLGLLCKGEFSKRVKAELNMIVVDKKIKGTRYRLFAKC